MDVSVVVPVLNESESLPELAREISAAFEGVDYEVIFVDDGSEDRSAGVVGELRARDPRLRLVRLARRSGKTAAWAAGFEAAAGRILVTMDADLQHDPRDARALVAVLAQGYDVVGGSRVKRTEGLRRRAASAAANAVIGALFGVRTRDLGCGLKAFTKEAAMAMPRFPGAHRFVLITLCRAGFRVAERPVSDRPRRFGESRIRLRFGETLAGIVRTFFSSRQP